MKTLEKPTPKKVRGLIRRETGPDSEHLIDRVIRTSSSVQQDFINRVKRSSSRARRVAEEKALRKRELIDMPIRKRLERKIPKLFRDAKRQIIDAAKTGRNEIYIEIGSKNEWERELTCRSLAEKLIREGFVVEVEPESHIIIEEADEFSTSSRITLEPFKKLQVSWYPSDRVETPS